MKNHNKFAPGVILALCMTVALAIPAMAKEGSPDDLSQQKIAVEEENEFLYGEEQQGEPVLSNFSEDQADAAEAVLEVGGWILLMKI